MAHAHYGLSYVKYVNKILYVKVLFICEICRSHFADVGWAAVAVQHTGKMIHLTHQTVMEPWIMPLNEDKKVPPAQ